MSKKVKILVLIILSVSLVSLVSYLTFFSSIKLDKDMVNDLKNNDKNVVFNTTGDGVIINSIDDMKNIDDDEYIYPKEGEKNVSVSNGNIYFKGVDIDVNKDEINVKSGNTEVDKFEYEIDGDIVEIKIFNALEFDTEYSISLGGKWKTSFKTEDQQEGLRVVDVKKEGLSFKVYFNDFISLDENKYTGVYEDNLNITKNINVDANEIEFILEEELKEDKFVFIHIPKNIIKTDVEKIVNKEDYNIILKEEK